MKASEGYQLVQRIGTGTGGAVYLAKADNRKVAIRQFESKADAATQTWRDERQWFLQAGNASLGLTHPRIVPVLEVIDEAGEAFVVMEYMAAPTLAATLASRRLGPAETDAILHQVAMALDFAHGRGVVHGDLKPADIFLSDKGAMLSDFAISPRARRYDRRPIAENLVHPYLSPEHLRDSGSIGPRSDQYSLAVIAYQMYTGRSPYGENFSDLSQAILNAPIMPPSQVDRQLPSNIDAPLLKALNRDPALRYGSCMEFIAFLGASLITLQEPARRRVPIFVYALVPVLLLALLALVWQPWRSSGASVTKKAPPLTEVAKPPTPSIPSSDSVEGHDSKGSTTKKTAATLVTKTGTTKQRTPADSGPGGRPRPPDPEPAAEPVTSPRFTLDVLSRGKPIVNTSSFNFSDPELGEGGKGDLNVLVSFEGQHLPVGPLQLEWKLDGQVVSTTVVVLKREQGAKHTAMTEYGNEQVPGTYLITLKQKAKVLQTFTFRINP